MQLSEFVEKRIEQIFLEIADKIDADELTEEEVADVSMLLLCASNHLVCAWRQFLELD